MKVSINWLSEILEVQLDAAETARRLTMAGLEVEALTRFGEAAAAARVVEVRRVASHPRADKLKVVEISDGLATSSVVCGAPNVPPPGGRVVWAAPGIRLPGGMVEARQVRGVASAGMLCSEAELGLGAEAAGILWLGSQPLQGSAAAGAHGAHDPTEGLLAATLGEVFGLPDAVLEINVTPNRGDCLGHIGVAREVAAALELSWSDPLTTAVPAWPPAGAAARLAGDALPRAADLATIEVHDPVGCPRYVGRVVDRLAVAPSPLWLRLRLSALGLRPVSNLVDVTNYVLLLFGQPLHAFDWERLAGRRIVVRRARAGETMVTLDGQERSLADEDLLICDGERPVALAGVMGGLDSEVTAATRRVLLESATFEPRAVRRTAKRLGLHTEASHRFERGCDPAAAELASIEAARLMAELGGGVVAEGAIDVYPRRLAPAGVSLRVARARRLLGLDLDAGQMAGLLRRIGLTVTVKDAVAQDAACLTVTVPTFRQDLTREADLCEEIVRLHGYDRVPATLPQGSREPAAVRGSLADRVRDGLRAAGLFEAVTFAFANPRRVADLRLSPSDPRSRPLRVENPLREDQAGLRVSLLPGLLEVLAQNLSRGNGRLRLFEVGSVFIERSDQTAASAGTLPGATSLPEEPVWVAAVLAGTADDWLKPTRQLDFFDLSGVIESLLSWLGIAGHELQSASDIPYLHPGVAARLCLPGCPPSAIAGQVGVLGEVHPEVRARFGIECPVLACELSLAALDCGSRPSFRELPRFPQVVRDTSFFVDETVDAARIRRVLLGERESLVVAVQLLEEYREASKVPAGQKGMLWSVTYRAGDRTLTDDEVNQAHQRLRSALRRELGVVER